MQLRLAFAVAAFLEPEILIIDEVLAVGDAEFQKKCLGKMEDVSKSGRTILFVSHNLGAVTQLCSISVLLNGGAVVKIGKSNEVISQYLKQSCSDASIFERETIDKDIFIKKIMPQGHTGMAVTEFKHNEEILFQFNVVNKYKEDRYRLLVIILDDLKRRIFSTETFITSTDLRLSIEAKTLVRGRYSMSCIIYIPGVSQFDIVDDCCPFSVFDGGSHFAHLETFDYGTVFAKTFWNNTE